jgi:hypothetical protein
MEKYQDNWQLASRLPYFVILHPAREGIERAREIVEEFLTARGRARHSCSGDNRDVVVTADFCLPSETTSRSTTSFPAPGADVESWPTCGSCTDIATISAVSMTGTI